MNEPDGTREQKHEFNHDEAARVKDLLQRAMTSVGDDDQPDRNLWPAMLRRMDEEHVRGAASVPWFDWALAAGLVAFAAMAPRTIPVILYYL